MVNARKLLYIILRLDKHKKFKPYKNDKNFIPLLSVNPETTTYRFNCYCFDCPVNEDGLCRTTFDKIPLNSYVIHEFDGDNIIRNYCG